MHGTNAPRAAVDVLCAAGCAGLGAACGAAVAIGAGPVVVLAATFVGGAIGCAAGMRLGGAIGRGRRSASPDDDLMRDIGERFASMSDGILVVADGHGRTLWVSDAYERLTGWTRADLDRSDWRTRVHPDDLAIIEATRQRNLDGEATRIVYRCRLKDGSFRWIDLHCVPRLDDAGKVERLFSSGRDVTELVLLEQRLREQAERTELALRGAKVGVWEWDPASGRVWWSEQMYALYGLDPATTEPSVDAWLKVLCPTERARMIDAIATAGQTSIPRSVEFRIVVGGGTSRVIRVANTEIRDASGVLQRFVGVASDVTELRDAERALVEANRRLEEAQDLARLGSWSYDLRTGVVSWSRQVYRMFGRDEALGPPDYAWVLDSYEPDSAARLDAAVREAVARGTPYDLVLRPSRPVDGIRIVRGRGGAVFDEDGRTPIALLGTVADVTAEIEREEALRRAREAADAANVAKSEFLANMSHELRTPMTAVLGFGEVLASDPDAAADPKRRAEYLDAIRRNGRHLLSIINDVLDLSKVEAGKLRVESVPTSVEAIIADVVESMRVAAEDKGIGLEFRSSVPRGHRMPCDPLRLRQIATNLLANAVKFTAQGCVTIDVDLVDDGRGCAVRVADTGIGIAAEDLPRLFHAFEQAEGSTSRRFGGTGLGLRISKRLAELLGGTIEASSTLGRGSVFTLRLPVAGARRLDG
jgi:PAS domain S-box-containing protein